MTRPLCTYLCFEFSVNEDFDAYPIQKEEDRRKLEEAGCDVVFEPVSLYGSLPNRSQLT